MAGPILANGKQYGWGSVILVLASGQIEVEGWTEVTWGHKRTRTKGYGQGRHHAPQVRTSGKYEVDNVKIKFRKDHADALRLGLAAMSSGVSYGNVVFPIMIQLVEDDVVSSIEFRDATVAVEGGTMTEGPDGIMEEIEFDIMRALLNGLTLYDSDQPGSPL